MYTVPQHSNSNKIFIINRSNLEGRLDPLYYNSDLTKFNAGVYKSVPLRSIVLSFKSGIGAGKQDQTTDESGLIQIRPTNIDENGFLKFDKNIYLPIEKDFERLEIGDVLFNNTNSQELVGKTAILKEEKELTYSNHITVIKPKGELLSEYLWIILNLYQKNKIFYTICTNWNNQSGIGIELLKSLKIPLPPKEVQKEIVDFYECAYIQKQLKIEEADILLKSIDNYLLEKLGISLPQKDNSLNKRIFTTQLYEITGGRFDVFAFLNKNYKIEGGEFINHKLKKLALLVKGQSITSDKIVKGSYPVIAGGQTSPYNHNKYNHKDNVITISASGAYSGFVWYHTYPIFASDCIVVKSRNENIITTLFLSEILKIKQGEIYNLQQGAGQPHVYARDLEKINIPLPPLEVQNEITSYIQNIRNKVNSLQQEAKDILDHAKQQVEQMILGNVS